MKLQKVLLEADDHLTQSKQVPSGSSLAGFDTVRKLEDIKTAMI